MTAGADDNKRNLVYFGADSMRALYETMDGWQAEHRKRLQSMSVESDGGLYCCIANPSRL